MSFKLRSHHAFQLCTVIASAAIVTSGCSGIYLEGSDPTLPDLTDAQQVQVAAAKHEQAFAGGVASLKLGADQLDRSRARLRLLGGEWKPWNGPTPSGAPAAPAADPVAKTAADLARYGIDTALADLNTARISVPERERTTYAWVSVARLADTLQIAQKAGVEQARIETWLAGPAPGHDAAPALDNEEKLALARAVRDWDCLAQRIPLQMDNSKAEHKDGPQFAHATALREQLLDTVTRTLTGTGVADRRLPSCDIKNAAAKETADTKESAASKKDVAAKGTAQLYRQLLQVNLQLFASAPNATLPGEKEPLAVEQLLNTTLLAVRSGHADSILTPLQQ